MSSDSYFAIDGTDDFDILWQAVDVEQRVLDDARVLWKRNVQQNLRDAVILFPATLICSCTQAVSGCA